MDENFGGSAHERRRVLDRLSAIPGVRSASDANGLRALLNHIQTTKLQLESLNVRPEHYALAFENNVHKVIPASLLLDFENDARREALSQSAEPPAGDQLDVVEGARKRLQQLIVYLQQYTIHLEESTRSQPRPKEQSPKNGRKPPSVGTDRQNKVCHTPDTRKVWGST